MTDLPADFETQGTPRRASTFVQIPIDLIGYVRSLKLTGAQYELWLYLWELDPYGDRWVEVPSPDAIAQFLKVSARTITRATQRLQDCKLFDFNIERWKCRNTTVSAKTHNFSTDKNIRVRTKRSQCGQFDPSADKKIPVSADGSNCPEKKLKPVQRNGSKSPQTIQTKQTFTDSLSEAERERFLEFCEQEAEKCQNPPISLIESWVEKNFDQLWRRFEKQQKRSAAPVIDWATHPQREEYLAALRERGRAWIGTCYDPEEKRRRNSFWEWAKREGLIGGTS